jgi:hypothetical protein
MKTQCVRRSVPKQEELVGALHDLIRQNDAARASGGLLTTGRPADGPPYTFDREAMGGAIERIMGIFGYAVTEIQ